VRWPPTFALMVLCSFLAAPAASAQESVRDVLSFLLTNRSVATGDFVRDEEAAAATASAISGFLLGELSTLPISSSAGGFSYRLDPTLGTVMRSSDSFGPFFTERSLTAGARQASLTVSYRQADFDTLGGRNLRDGTLVSTASALRSDAEPFDVETLSLRIRTDTMTFSGNVGVSDRLDLSAALPFVRLTMSGQRVDTYRGTEILQAAGSANASGIGDIVVRAKYNLLRRTVSGVTVAGEMRLPTGRDQDLLGAGKASVTPRLIASHEGERFGAHGDVGYRLGGISDDVEYNAAVTFVGGARLTVVGELLGRRSEGGRLAAITQPHPGLIGVDTIRLTATEDATHRLGAVAGIKWNPTGSWIVSGNILRSLTSGGLNAAWVPTLTFDYSFAR
jgi:Putative MetA-pathway of phenol degradation